MQIFHRSFNTIAKFTIFGGLFIVGLVVWILAMIARSPYMTQVDVAPDQPVPFSHEHHVNGVGIDCRYCHTSVEKGPMAGLPPTKTCMTCHSQIWADSPMLEPVRKSLRENTPIEWTRVNDLPDFVYFDHSIHIKKGINCNTCHGPIHQMPLTRKKNTFHMQWCLECHRDPQKFIGERENVFDSWHPKLSEEERAKLMKQYNVKKMTDCSTCHR